MAATENILLNFNVGVLGISISFIFYWYLRVLVFFVPAPVVSALMWCHLNILASLLLLLLLCYATYLGL